MTPPADRLAEIERKARKDGAWHWADHEGVWQPQADILWLLAELARVTAESTRVRSWVWWLSKYVKGRASLDDIYVLCQAILPPDGLSPPRTEDDQPETWASALARAKTAFGKRAALGGTEET